MLVDSFFSVTECVSSYYREQVSNNYVLCMNNLLHILLCQSLMKEMITKHKHHFYI